VKLATVSYEAGAITNLELLDAEINLAESKLMLVKSQIDYQISLTALDLAIGNRLY
jgi:outer membrane protein TolC